MATRAFPIVLFAAAGLPTALGWGTMGHEAVAYIATNFVATETKSYFQDLLGDTSADYLASVASWADSYRYTTAGKFSAPFHYIDANDSPPSSCGIEMSRDCGSEGCVVSAIANYTAQLLKTDLSSAQRQIAAKMVIHLVGDVGQPLHCENLEVGGNDIDVTYDGSATNLHSVWDSAIAESIAGGSTESSAKSWASTLTTEIKTGTYKSVAAGWVSGLSVTNAEDSSLVWAKESNTEVCSTVLAKGIDYVENNDLSGAYTDTATPVVNLQIAKQGYRLAKWLDGIVAAV